MHVCVCVCLLVGTGMVAGDSMMEEDRARTSLINVSIMDSVSSAVLAS